MLKTVYSCIHRITKRIEVGNYKRRTRGSRRGPRALICLLAGARLSRCPCQSSEGAVLEAPGPRGPCPGRALSRSPAPPRARMQVPRRDQHLRSPEDCCPSAGVGFGEGVGTPEGRSPFYWTPNWTSSLF